MITIGDSTTQYIADYNSPIGESWKKTKRYNGMAEGFDPCSYVSIYKILYIFPICFQYLDVAQGEDDDPGSLVQDGSDIGWDDH